jgi:ABC-type antimicrobial peptide transport system permease subunit
MIRHFITVAFRNFWKNRFHTTINVVGLAIGVSACLVIYLIVTFELSFNRLIPERERIYRVYSKFTGEYRGLNSGAPAATSSFIKDHFKGVQEVSLFFLLESKVTIPAANGKTKLEAIEKAIFASHDYFKVFDCYQWVLGNAASLEKPFQVAITESQAKKYFGTTQYDLVIGKTLIYNDSIQVNVSGVIKDLSIRTDLEFTDFISLATVSASSLKKDYPLDDWTTTNSSTQIFVKAQPSMDEQQLIDQLPLLSKVYNEKNSFDRNDFGLQPMLDVHFNTELGIFDFSRAPAQRQTIYVLIAVAISLLLLGAINFINLETAQAARRAKEVGIRKVLGSNRLSLILQFLSESLVITLVSILLALPLAELGLRYFSDFIPTGVTLNIRVFVPFLVLFVIFISIITSSYPAFLLSSFVPAIALKNKIYTNGTRSRSGFLRRALIVFQFTFAQALILGSLIIWWQIRFILNKDLGFKKDSVIYFDSPWWERADKANLLKTELGQIAEVKDLAMSSQPPSYSGWSSSVLKYNNGKEERNINAYRKFADTAYLSFYDIKLLAGRNLSSKDTISEFIINETMCKMLGFKSPEKALNEMIDLNYNNKKVPIVGVVKDFNFQSLHHKVGPVVMANTEKDFRCFNIRLQTENQRGEQLQISLKKIENAWKKIYPDVPFEYHFLDDSIRRFYEAEQRTSKLSKFATALAIFISCIGLFGLASYTSVQRTKEIGVRKVMGANVFQIVFMLSRDFLILVTLGFVVAVPITWFGIQQWLSGFSYRTDFSPWLFIATAISACIVAFVTVSYQTIKAANSNPIESLRSE